MIRTIGYFAVVLGLAAATAGVGTRRAGPPDAWRGAEPAEAPRRIASLSPSTTELCAALGLMERLVARCRYCDWPPQVGAVADVGGLVDPNLEGLMLLRPDLVLVPGRSLLLQEAMTGLGVRIVSLPDSTLKDVFTALETLGGITWRAEAARREVSRIRSELRVLSAEATAAWRGGPRLRVLLVVERMGAAPASVHVAGPGSYLDELLRLAGHENAMPDLGRPWGEVAVEEVVRANPEAILEFPETGRAQAAEQAAQAWSKVGPLKAVRAGRVAVLAGRQHTVPGPRVAETLRAMVAALKP